MKRTVDKIQKITVTICMILSVSSSCMIRAAAEEVSKVKAMVNNEVITSKDLDDYCRFLKYKNPELEITDALKAEVLQRLIEDKLILSQAREEIKEVPPRWLKEKIDDLVSSYPSYTAFEESLINEGLTLTGLKEKLKVQYLTQGIVDKEVRSGIEVSPQEITDYYNEHKVDFVVPRECVLWVGKSQNRELFDELDGILKNTPIEEVDDARYNISRLEIKEGSLKPEIKELVRELNVGEHVIRQMGDMYYFVYVEKITPFSLVNIEDVKEKLFAFLWEKKFKAAFTEWLESLKEKAFIRVYE